MPAPDFNLIIDGALAFFQSLNTGAAPGGLALGVKALAEARDAAFSTTTASMYTDYNPAWTVDRGEIDAIEDLAPIVRLDMVDWPHDEADGSGDNYVQYWRLEKAVGIAAIGADRLDAERRYFDVCSFLIDRFMGSGAYLGLNRGLTGLERAMLTGGRWASSARGDQFICSGFMLLRIRCRWEQSND